MEADHIRGIFLKCFWTSCVSNEFDWGSRYHINMEFSCAVAVMDKFGGWKKRKEDENQSGARFGVCMWIFTKSVLSPRPEVFEELHVHITFDYRGNQQDLGLSPRNSRMVTTIFQEWQNYEVIAVCTLEFRALCRSGCYDIRFRAI